MFLILVCLGFLAAGFSFGEICTSEVANRLDRCNQLWGFDEQVVTSRQLIYGRPMINISQLLTYCRTPDRADISECEREAIGDCNRGLSTDKNDFSNKLINALGQAVNFLCSKESVLERNQACLDGISNRIVRCAHGAWLRYVENMERSTPWEAQKQLMERMGRSRKRCIVKVVKKRCNSEVADVFGNFLYGATIYPHDEDNQSRR